MIGDKNQDQAADAGATAIQAGRDVHYHGLSVEGVKEICMLILRDNFPKLREEASRAAEVHVREFANVLEKQLTDNALNIVLDKFSDPDVQAAINDAVQASARKGDSANPQLLATLISERVAKESSPFKDIVISEAVQTVPKLTSAQVSLLSFTHVVCNVQYDNLRSLIDIEQHGIKALEFSRPGFDLSQSQWRHLQYAGTASINTLMGGNIFDSLRDYYSKHIPEGANFRNLLHQQAPSYAELLDKFNSENIFQIELTSVGKAIAIANISKHFGNLDYSIWLK